MRRLLYGGLGFLLMIVMMQPGLAQETTGVLATTPIYKPADFGKEYDARCMKNFFLGLSTKTRADFCACTAAHAEQSLSPEQQQMLATGKGTAVEAKQMALNIISPCLGTPIEEMQTRQCLSDKSYGNFYKTADAFAATCQCIGRGMGDYIRADGQAMMGYLIATYPHTEDQPLDSILNAIDFRSTSNDMRVKCLNLFAYH